MNKKQLQYAIELSESLNFSQVAEKLGITQPALSKQILNLEKELGVKLFDRNSVPMVLTSAGEYFVKEAKKIIYRENQLLRSLEDFKKGQRGKLEIGISPFRSLYLLPVVAEKVREKYPGIQIVLNEAGSEQLRKDAAEGLFDFAVVNLPVDESVLDVTLIEPDKLVLAVPKKLLHKLHVTSEGNSIPKININVCNELPFVVVGQSQEMRQLFEKICAEAEFSPNIAMEVVGVSTAWAMTRKGIGATLLPLQFIKNFETDDDIALFTLENSTYSRQPAIITRKGQYISEYARYAIKLLTEI